jgi:hypothetical protein
METSDEVLEATTLVARKGAIPSGILSWFVTSC